MLAAPAQVLMAQELGPELQQGAVLLLGQQTVAQLMLQA
jgi:hypothetical protein